MPKPLQFAMRRMREPLFEMHLAVMSISGIGPALAQCVLKLTSDPAMKKITSLVLATLSLTVSALDSRATDQYADTVIAFSSEYSNQRWSAAQTLGPPDTFAYGDLDTAWAPSAKNGTLEYITVGFPAPVRADAVTIRETFGNGFVFQVDVRDLAGVYHTVWVGIDPSQPGMPVDFLVEFPLTGFMVDAVRVHVDTDHDLSAWEEIDAVVLHGVEDSDGDGVPDGVDVCPNSIMTETVVIRGCDTGVVNMVFDDGCTLADVVQLAGDEARNHGAFVSSIVKLADALQRTGWIDRREAVSLVRCAARGSRRQR